MRALAKLLLIAAGWLAMGSLGIAIAAILAADLWRAIK